MRDSQPETFDENLAQASWTRFFAGTNFSWGAMLTLGWLIYEITARPSCGVVVACAKFGWNDFLTAHWLLRTDPDQPRGRTCFWFYLANGLWKITIAAFLATGLLLILMVALNDNPPHMLIGVGMTAALGVTLLAVIPLIGVFNARWHNVRVWVDATVHESRQAGEWPPRPSGINATMGLLFPSLMVPIMLTALLTLHLGVVPMLVSVFSEGIFIWSLFRGVCAETPVECWASRDVPSLDDEPEYASTHEPAA